MTGMAVETSEYRKRLLAQGCDEGLADAVLALVGEARDDAVAEAIARTGEQVKTSDQVLGERLNGHVGKMEGQFNSLMSTIRGTASDLTTMFERRFTQLWDRINGLEIEVKGELAEVRGELGGRIDGVKGGLAETKGELKGETGELKGEIVGLKGEVAGLKTKIDGLETKIDGLETKIAGLEKMMSGFEKAMEKQGEALRAEFQGAVYRAAFGLGMLIIGVAGVLTGLAAAGVFG